MDMKMVLNSVHPSLVKVLDAVKMTNSENEVNCAKAGKACAEEELEDEHVGLHAKFFELHEIIDLLTDGESKLLIMSAAGGDGLRALQPLTQQYARPTLSRSLHHLREVVDAKQLLAS